MRRRLRRRRHARPVARQGAEAGGGGGASGAARRRRRCGRRLRRRRWSRATACPSAGRADRRPVTQSVVQLQARPRTAPRRAAPQPSWHEQCNTWRPLQHLAAAGAPGGGHTRAAPAENLAVLRPGRSWCCRQRLRAEQRRAAVLRARAAQALTSRGVSRGGVGGRQRAATDQARRWSECSPSWCQRSGLTRRRCGGPAPRVGSTAGGLRGRQ